MVYIHGGSIFMKTFDKICYILLLIGGINWGLVGIFDFNLVDFIFAKLFIDRIVYVLVGLSAVYLIIACKNVKMRCCSKKK